MTSLSAYSPARPQACQRWAPGGVMSWARPERYDFNPARYGVAAIADDTTAKTFVETLHYSRSYVAAVHRFGLYDLAMPVPELVGVAVLSSPQNKRVLTNVFPDLEPFAESLELGRFALRDAVPHRAESWFAGQVRRLAAHAGVRGIVAFSDPMRRTLPNGTVIFPGHWGTAYQASNALHCGRSAPRTEWRLPDGSVIGERTLQKIRKQECGHAYAERQLIDRGAPVPRAGERPAGWVRRALPAAGARRRLNPGKLRYAWPVGITRRDRAAVVLTPTPQPYPKADLEQPELPGIWDATGAEPVTSQDQEEGDPR